MGIYIKIAKSEAHGLVGYYEVSTKDFGGAHFYIGIDKDLKKITLYASKDINSFIAEIDCASDAPINTVANIPIAILGRVVMQATKAFDMDTFPEYLSYEA